VGQLSKGDRLYRRGDAHEHGRAVLVLAALDAEPEAAEDRQHPLDVGSLAHQ